MHVFNPDGEKGLGENQHGILEADVTLNLLTRISAPVRSFRNLHHAQTEINDRIRASHSIPFTLMPSLLNHHEMCINQKGIFFPRNHKCRKVAFRESAFGFSVSHTLLSLDLDLAVFHRRSVHGSKIPINWDVSRISVSV